MAKWRTAKVFISSTFRDMHAERDHLVKVVFPELRERLLLYRVYLDDIDLRWGITEEESKKDKVLDLCLQQIDECRPFFIGILGERYGWVPTTPISREAARRFEKYGLTQLETGQSVTELEILFGVLLMEPRMKGRSFFYFRDPRFLNTVLKDRRQEVRHQYQEFPIQEEVTELGYKQARREAAIRRLKLRHLKHKIRAVREQGYPVFENYQGRWESKTFDRPTKTHGRLVDLKDFGLQVLDQLWKAIKAEFKLPDQPPAPAGPDDAARLAAETDYQARFLESRLRVYVGREDVQRNLVAYALGKEPMPCLVTGPSGSGKSAALAQFVDRAAEDMPGVPVIAHFIGASPRSTALRDALKRLCSELYDKLLKTEKHMRLAVITATGEAAEKQRKSIEQGFSIPEEIAPLVTTWRNFLTMIPEQHRVVIVLDALNQLEEGDRARELWWLPRELGPHVKVLASSIIDPESAEAESDPVARCFHQRSYHELRIADLSDTERRQIIRAVPSLSAKTLDDVQVDLLLSNPATSNPLFLLVTLEELRGFGAYEQLDLRIVDFPHPVEQEPRWHRWLINAKQAAESVPDEKKREDQLKRLLKIESALNAVESIDDALTDVFRQVIERLGTDFDPEVVRSVLSLMASARRGLSQRELLSLVEGPDVEIGDSKSDLFIVLRQLRPYLLNRGGLLGFFHGNLQIAVRRYYLDNEESRRIAHFRLASYFYGEGHDENGTWPWRSNRPRSLSELPYHQAYGGLYRDLASTLCDPAFLEAKCRIGMAFDVLHDFECATEVSDLPQIDAVRQVYSAALPWIHSRPEITAQEIINRLAWQDARSSELERTVDQAQSLLDTRNLWIRAEAPLPETRNKRQGIVPFGIESEAQAISSNGKWIAAASYEGEVEIRELATGELFMKHRIATERIIALALDQEGEFAAFMDGSAQVHDGMSGTILCVRQGERRLAILAEFGIPAVLEDDTLIVWEPRLNRSVVLQTNLPRPLRVLRVAPGSLCAIYLAGDSSDAIGIIERVDNSWTARSLPYSGPRVIDVSLSNDGTQALLATQDRKLHLLDSKAGKPLVKPLAYEIHPTEVVRGTPHRCALGFGETAGSLFLATGEGHIARWDWIEDRLERLEDFRAPSESKSLVLFEVVPPVGRLFISSDTLGKFVTKQANEASCNVHLAAVGDTLVTEKGEVISSSLIDQTVRWLAADGLHQLGTKWIPDSLALAFWAKREGVLVGTRRGWVVHLSLTAENETPEPLVNLMEPVVSLFVDEDGWVVAACRSGKVVRMNPETGEPPRVVRYASGMLVQKKIFPARRKGWFWSVHRDIKPGRTVTSVSLIRGPEREKVVFWTGKVVEDAAVAPDNSTICLAGNSVMLLGRRCFRWRVVHSRDTAASHVAYLATREMIVVAQTDFPWLEVWALSEGMPTLASIGLPSKVTCLSTFGDRIVVGLKSGGLMSVRLRGIASRTTGGPR